MGNSCFKSKSEKMGIAFYSAMQEAKKMVEKGEISKWEHCLPLQDTLRVLNEISKVDINGDYRLKILQKGEVYYCTTIFNFAVLYGTPEFCQRLLEHPNIDPNETDKLLYIGNVGLYYSYNGVVARKPVHSAIHIAIEKADVPMIKFLISCDRVDKNLPDMNFLQPVELIENSQAISQQDKTELIELCATVNNESRRLCDLKRF